MRSLPVAPRIGEMEEKVEGLAKLSNSQIIGTHETRIVHKSEGVASSVCQHRRLREIGQDFDRDGILLRLVRCRSCGLLMRQYLPTL
jgi:hypothetical protein